MRRMKSIAGHRLGLFVCLLSALPGVVCAAESASTPLIGYFSAPVTVDAAGKMAVGDVSGVKGALSDAVRAKLVDLKVVPASRDGAAITAEMMAQGRAVLTPVDAENYSLTVEGLTLLPPASAGRVVPPRYPVEMYTRDREGNVEVELTIDPAGRIVDVRTVSSTDPAFTKAVTAALKQWEFNASEEGARFSVPVVFRIADKRRTPVQPKFECSLPPGQAHVVGQDGCLPLIEVVGSRVLRSTTHTSIR